MPLSLLSTVTFTYQVRTKHTQTDIHKQANIRIQTDIRTETDIRTRIDRHRKTA